MKGNIKIIAYFHFHHGSRYHNNDNVLVLYVTFLIIYFLSHIFFFIPQVSEIIYK